MSADIVGFRGQVVIQPGLVNQALIDDITELLERAKAGDIVGIAYAALHSDKASSYAVSGCHGTYGMIGALECAKAVLIDVNTHNDT